MKSKQHFQHVKFSTVQECIDFLPEKERKLTLTLRNLIFECIPNIQEKLSFNVPFYKVKKGICFIWPAAILWGKKQTYDGVRFGFQYGNKLYDPDGFLKSEHRKQVYWRNFESITASELIHLKELLFQAYMVDQEV